MGGMIRSRKIAAAVAGVLMVAAFGWLPLERHLHRWEYWAYYCHQLDQDKPVGYYCPAADTALSCLFNSSEAKAAQKQRDYMASLLRGETAGH